MWGSGERDRSPLYVGSDTSLRLPSHYRVRSSSVDVQNCPITVGVTTPVPGGPGLDVPGKRPETFPNGVSIHRHTTPPARGANNCRRYDSLGSLVHFEMSGSVCRTK